MVLRGTLLAPLFLLSGCADDYVQLDGPADAPMTLVLEFSVEADEDQYLEIGDHCGFVDIEGGVLVIEEDAAALDGERPLLAVFPSSTTSRGNDGPYAASLPYSPALQWGDDANYQLFEVAWEDGKVTIDGEAVALPYSFVREGPDGIWHAEGELREGPGKIRTYDGGKCE